jgi:hypothetical protein
MSTSYSGMVGSTLDLAMSNRITSQTLSFFPFFFMTFGAVVFFLVVLLEAVLVFFDPDVLADFLFGGLYNSSSLILSDEEQESVSSSVKQDRNFINTHT